MSANTPVLNKGLKRIPFAMIVLVVAVVLSYIVTNPIPSLSLSGSQPTNDLNTSAVVEADAARYTAMAEFYATQEEINRLSLEADAARYTAMTAAINSIQLSLEADAARYTAMAKHYTELETARNQRSLEADAARYTAMAAAISSIQNSLETDAARYTTQAKYYAELETARNQRSLEADAARYTTMAEFYLSK